MKLPIASIRTDGGTQSRAEIKTEVALDYSEHLDELPPVVVFHDGAAYWLADGFHRITAATIACREEIEAEVRQGTQRDARLYSYRANRDHGLRMTREDKRRNVRDMLEDPEWSKWSDRAIAEHIGVSNHLVADVRRDVIGNSPNAQPAMRKTKDGRKYPAKRAAPAKPTSAEEPEPDGEEEDPAPRATPPRHAPAPEPEPFNVEVAAALAIGHVYDAAKVWPRALSLRPLIASAKQCLQTLERLEKEKSNA